MKRLGTIALATLVMASAGCGGEDEGGSDQPVASEDEARELVIAAIEAYQQEDYATLCELSDSEVNAAIPKAAETETCAEGYAALFRRQDKLGGERPFDDYVKTLSQTEVGEATVTAEGAIVELEGPDGRARSFLVAEDGELRVQELYLSKQASTAQAGGSSVAPGE